MEYTLRARALVPGDPGAVFDLITDLDRLPDWNLEVPGVLEAPPHLEVGSEWVVAIHAMGTRWHSRSTATEVDRDRGRFSYRSQSDDGNPSQAIWRWHIVDAAADDASEVTVEVDVRPRTFIRKWFLSRLRRRSLQAAIQASLEALGSLPVHPHVDHAGDPS